MKMKKRSSTYFLIKSSSGHLWARTRLRLWTSSANHPYLYFFFFLTDDTFGISRFFKKICPFLFVLNFFIIEKQISEFKTSQWMLLSTLSFRLSCWLRQQRICLKYGRPGTGRSPGGGHSNPLQYSCLENPSGQRSLACFTKNQTWLSNSAHTHTYTLIHSRVWLSEFIGMGRGFLTSRQVDKCWFLT